MIQQYRVIKNQYKDAVLFFRLGDFYEMFDEDAHEVSRLLNLTLTHRAGHVMCGIPYHSSRIYIGRLLRLGKKIAVCEQMTVPGPGKGLAERRVTEVITPGTAVDEDYLEQSCNNYLAALACCGTGGKKTIGFSYIDVTTGEFCGMEFPFANVPERLRKEVGRVQPSEILIQQSLFDTAVIADLCGEYPAMVVNRYPDWAFDLSATEPALLAQFGTASLKPFGIPAGSAVIPAAGVLVDYVKNTARRQIPHVETITLYGDNEFVSIDDATKKNLELVQNLRDGTASFTLYEVLNDTRTSMGARLLRSWILHPLCGKRDIDRRLARVSAFYADTSVLNDVRGHLSGILDVERLASRAAMDKAHAKDLVALRASLARMETAESAACAIDEHSRFLSVDEWSEVSALRRCLDDSLLDDPSVLLSEGNMIKPGWNAELDKYRSLKENSHNILTEYLESEKKKTGITTLRIRYNRIIGYYLEVSKSYLGLVPDYFIRRQTLVNGDRFITDRLVELETEINSSSDKIVELERSLFLEIRNRVKTGVPLLLKAAHALAELDVVQSFARQAFRCNWCCPVIAGSGPLSLTAARHPVVEAHMPAGDFMPNDLSLDADGVSFALITGPNMAGKSTFLRQTALAVLMAQIGSFVPAAHAVIPVADRIFCRVGASDNLVRGESTFLMEMNETAHILHAATKKSLVIMDEVGRGTSTEDGLSIAWAVSECLLNSIGAKTLFATHYHELSRMEHPKLCNLCLDVLEKDGSIIFLKKVIPGAASSSYGIHVAKLAGLPGSVIARAGQILAGLTAANDGLSLPDVSLAPAKPAVPELFPEEELIINEIAGMNPDTITPIEALQAIARWKRGLSDSK